MTYTLHTSEFQKQVLADITITQLLENYTTFRVVENSLPVIKCRNLLI